MEPRSTVPAGPVGSRSPTAIRLIMSARVYQWVAPHPSRWTALFSKVSAIEWQGFLPEELRSIKAPVLVASGDHDPFPIERFSEAFRLIPNATDGVEIRVSRNPIPLRLELLLPPQRATRMRSDGSPTLTSGRYISTAIAYWVLSGRRGRAARSTASRLALSAFI